MPATLQQFMLHTVSDSADVQLLTHLNCMALQRQQCNVKAATRSALCAIAAYLGSTALTG